MKKRIYLALLPIAMLWCGCSENEYDHTREITAVASAANVTVSQSTRTAITSDSFGGKDARVLATETSGSYSDLYCNGIMSFNDKDDVARYSGTYYGKNSFPDSGDPQTVWLSGLYPATGWGCDTGKEISGGVVTYTVDGKTDIMYAKEEDTQKGGSAALTFDHQLTLLKIKLEKPETNARIKVHAITLIGTGAAGGLVHPVCSVNLNTQTVLAFSGGQSTTTLPCWLTGAGPETPFTEKDIDPTDTDEAEAYILAPPLNDGEFTGKEDYTFKVVYSIGAGVEELTAVVPLNLEVTNDVDFDVATAGYSFEITIRFVGGDVAATAEITGWNQEGEDVTLVLPPGTLIPQLTPLENTGAIDNLTNCYMVVPGEELVFPVTRAYVYNNGPTNTLRTGGEYTDDFTAEVLWQDAAVIKGTPKVYLSGNQTRVALKTNAVHGNACVAIRKKYSDIVWSYHIWVTNMVLPDPSVPDFSTDYADYTLMRYDLGDDINDTSNNKNGLIYQWGRKDPFHFDSLVAAMPAFSMVDKTDETKHIEFTTANPEKLVKATPFRWVDSAGAARDWIRTEGKKSLYDPCPLDTEVLTAPANGITDVTWVDRWINIDDAWTIDNSDMRLKYNNGLWYEGGKVIIGGTGNKRWMGWNGGTFLYLGYTIPSCFAINGSTAYIGGWGITTMALHVRCAWHSRQ
jgi:hypothetical protein